MNISAGFALSYLPSSLVVRKRPPAGGIRGGIKKAQCEGVAPGLGVEKNFHNEASTVLFSLTSAITHLHLSINTALLYDQRLRLFGS